MLNYNIQGRRKEEYQVNTSLKRSGDCLSLSSIYHLSEGNMHTTVLDELWYDIIFDYLAIKNLMLI